VERTEHGLIAVQRHRSSVSDSLSRLRMGQALPLTTQSHEGSVLTQNRDVSDGPVSMCHRYSRINLHARLRPQV
jgi:hypothetical protein